MSDRINHYCYHCFCKVDPSVGAYCPECGKKHSVHYAQSCELPAGTYLKNNRYLVGASIGSGGFGISYVGYDLLNEKKILVKETFYNGIFKRNCYDRMNPNPLKVSYGSEFSLPQIMRKTEKECMALSEGQGLNNIVRVYDCFSENNTAYIITEFIDGVTLDERVCSQGRYSWNELYVKLVPLMYNLQALHNRGVIHRDIKPQNIMIRNGTGDFVLIDFGLARSLETKTLASVGVSFSPGYSPIEQRSFSKRDNTYTDIYSLAATIYFAITGEQPSLDIHETIDENFPKINLMRSEYGVPENVIRALRHALNPNYNLRCGKVSELMQMLSGVEKQPHYLRGNPQQNLNGNAKAPVRSDADRQRIKNEYYRKKIEREEQSLKQQREIDDTLSKLVGYYKKRKPKYGVDPIDFRKFILPAVAVLFMILFLIVTK